MAQCLVARERRSATLALPRKWIACLSGKSSRDASLPQPRRNTRSGRLFHLSGTAVLASPVSWSRQFFLAVCPSSRLRSRYNCCFCPLIVPFEDLHRSKKDGPDCTCELIDLSVMARYANHFPSVCMSDRSLPLIVFCPIDSVSVRFSLRSLHRNVFVMSMRKCERPHRKS